MPEAQRLLAEALALADDRRLVLRQMVAPEGERADRHGIAGRADLTRTRAALYAHLGEGEGGRDRADLGVGIGVVEVIERHRAVEQDRLLDHALADDLGEEVDVLLRAPDAAGDVMQTVDACCHFFLPTGFNPALECHSKDFVMIGTVPMVSFARQQAGPAGRVAHSAFDSTKSHVASQNGFAKPWLFIAFGSSFRW